MEVEATSTPRENQLSDINFLRIFYECFDQEFVHYLSTTDLASLLRALPEAGRAMDRYNMNRLLAWLAEKVWGSGRDPPRIELGNRMTAERFLVLHHWVQHTSIKGLGSTCALDAYHEFPVRESSNEVDTEEMGAVLACCFLKPTTPWPLQNGLMLATSRGKLLVYLLASDCYELAHHFDAERGPPFGKLVSSPEGRSVLMLDLEGTLHLMTLGVGSVRVRATGVRAWMREMRPDMFLSEVEFLTETGAGGSERSKRRDLLLHAIDSVNCRVRTHLLAADLPGGDTVTLRLGGGDGGRREYVIRKRSCDKIGHYCCGIGLLEEPRTRHRRRAFEAFFADSLVADFVLSADKSRLYVAVMTSARAAKVMDELVLLEEESAAGVAKCNSDFAKDFLTNLAVYYLDLDVRGGLSAWAAFFPIFCKETCYVGSLPATMHTPWTHYLRLCIPASGECFLRCKGKQLAVRLAGTMLRFIWLELEEETSDFNYMLGAEKDVLDLSEEFNYLAAFSSAQNLQARSLFVGCFCKKFAAFTVEEKTRPTLSVEMKKIRCVSQVLSSVRALASSCHLNHVLSELSLCRRSAVCSPSWLPTGREST